ncbi:MAG: hypothetical protein AAF719_04715 [Pseudomonadota bacterium]
MDGVSQAKSPNVYAAIKAASQETGVDFDYLWRTAKRESSLDPSARAQTSSATGLFQFTNDTWLRMVDRYGDKHGLGQAAADVSVERNRVRVADADRRSEILALRKDPELSARMAAELANENSRILARKIDRAPTDRELYLAHFLGPADAGQLINAARNGETRSGADMFPRAANANRSIFYEASGEARSAQAIYARLTGETVGEAEAPEPDPSSLQIASLSLAGDAGQAAPGSSPSGTKLATGVLLALLDLQSKLSGPGR